MNYESKRNRIIRKYVTGIYHLNWIKLDGNSKINHMKKVCEICLKLKEKGLDFLTRPVIVVWNNEPSFWEKFWANGEKWEEIESKKKHYYPDILTFIKSPFKPVIIEVLDTEQKDHAESKSYPKEFKVIPFDVEDDVEELIV